MFSTGSYPLAVFHWQFFTGSFPLQFQVWGAFLERFTCGAQSKSATPIGSFCCWSLQTGLASPGRREDLLNLPKASLFCFSSG